MSQKAWPQALRFTQKLVKDKAYEDKAAVWLQHGECLFNLKRLDEAEQAYQKVVGLAPQHYEARRALSTILHQLGRPDEALSTLTQDEKAELLNPQLLYEKCQLLHSERHFEEFVNKSQLLLGRHFVDLRSREEVITLSSSRRHSKKRLNELRSFNLDFDLEQPQSEQPHFEADSGHISPRAEFDLFKKLCDVLYSRKDYPRLQRLTFSALGCPAFAKDPELCREVEFLCLLSAFLNKDAYHAYNYIRELVTKDGCKNSSLWNLFNLVIGESDDTRHCKFLMRLANKHPENAAIGLLYGNYCLLAGTYKYSLGEYMNVYKVHKDPMVPLMLGITFIHLACQKFSSKKHSLVVQACAFLQNYAKMRGPNCQEAYYNLGRAMHQVGILPAAIHYYKKVLALRPSVEEDPRFDLTREAAFNLSLIYKNSGSHELARTVIDKYIII